MKRVRPIWGFIGANAVVWMAMVCILVILPDQLERWLPMQFSRVIGWAAACGLWVVTVEQQWRKRCGPFTRFAIQFVLWVSAAVLAIWLDDQFRFEW